MEWMTTTFFNNHYITPTADDDKAVDKKGMRDKRGSEDRVKSQQRNQYRWSLSSLVYPSYPCYYTTYSIETRVAEWNDWDIYAQPFVPSYH